MSKSIQISKWYGDNQYLINIFCATVCGQCLHILTFCARYARDQIMFLACLWVCIDDGKADLEISSFKWSFTLLIRNTRDQICTMHLTCAKFWSAYLTNNNRTNRCGCTYNPINGKERSRRRIKWLSPEYELKLKQVNAKDPIFQYILDLEQVWLVFFFFYTA